MTDDYFQARGEGSSEEEGSLLGRGGPRRREYDGGSDVDGDVRSMVPGSTVSMFLEVCPVSVFVRFAVSARLTYYPGGDMESPRLVTENLRRLW